jgi:hypothetical protein
METVTGLMAGVTRLSGALLLVLPALALHAALSAVAHLP